jgi:hypothetical protein
MVLRSVEPPRSLTQEKNGNTEIRGTSQPYEVNVTSA